MAKKEEGQEKCQPFPHPRLKSLWKQKKAPSHIHDSFQILNILLKYWVMISLAKCVRHAPDAFQCILTHGQIQVVSFSQGSQSVQTPTLIVALQTLNKTCVSQMKEIRLWFDFFKRLEPWLFYTVTLFFTVFWPYFDTRSRQGTGSWISCTGSHLALGVKGRKMCDYSRKMQINWCIFLLFSFLICYLCFYLPLLTMSASHQTKKLRCSDEKPTNLWFYDIGHIFIRQ